MIFEKDVLQKRISEAKVQQEIFDAVKEKVLEEAVANSGGKISMEEASGNINTEMREYVSAEQWLDFEEAKRRKLVSRSAARVTYELCADCGHELQGLLDGALVGGL